MTQARFKKLERHDFVDDAPPTKPQGLPEAPTLEDVQDAEARLTMFEGDQAVHELYARFGVSAQTI
jgi:hypothetical protein